MTAAPGLLQQYVDTWNRHDGAAQVSTFADSGRMEDYEKTAGRCGCGQALPEPPPYW